MTGIITSQPAPTTRFAFRLHFRSHPEVNMGKEQEDQLIITSVPDPTKGAFNRDSGRSSKTYVQDTGTARKKKPWAILGIKTCSILLVCWTAALVVAIAQHLFYTHINQRAVDQFIIPQAWVIRIGNACAFLFKTTLAATVGIAYAQRVWYAVHNHAVEIGTLDTMVDGRSNPFIFLKPSLFRNATLLILVAIISWLLPFSAILAPGALTGWFLWRSEALIQVNSVETIASSSTVVAVLGPLDTNVGFASLGDTASSYALFGEPAFQLTQAVLRVLTSGEQVPFASPCGVNCSYIISFTGPAYECVNYNGPLSSIPVNPANLSGTLSGLANPQETNYLPPDQCVYWAIDYSNETVQDRNLVYGDIGLWMTYTNTDQFISGQAPIYNTVHCTLCSANYTANISYVNNIQIVETNVAQKEAINCSFLASLTFQYPTAEMFLDLNLYAVHEAIIDVINGYIPAGRSISGNWEYKDTMIQLWNGVVSLIPAGNLTQGNGITGGGLPTPVNLSFSDNMSQDLENLMVNVTMSLIGMLVETPTLPLFYSNFSSGYPFHDEETIATITTYPVVYIYQPKFLWVIYGAALAASAICILLGIVVRIIGPESVSFSEFLIATRNPALDQISEGIETGGKAAKKRFVKTKLKYGNLAGTDKTCFGLEDEMVPVTKRK